LTYLNLIKAVMRRLRESEPSDLTATYTLQIGDYVNEAINWVENAWNWMALRSELTITTSASTAQYTLTGAGTRIGVEIVIDETNNRILQPKSNAWYKVQEQTGTIGEGAPEFYCFEGVDASGELLVNLYPTPDATLTIKLQAIQPATERTTATQTTNLPAKPSIDYAYALAAEERGEAGGAASLTLYAKAQRSLGDAVAHDNNLYSPDTDWYPV